MALGTRRQARLGFLLLAGLLCLLAWRIETPWRRAQAAYFDRVLEISRAELAVRRAELADELRFLTSEVEVARDQLPLDAVADSEQRLLDLERKLRQASEKDPSGREAEGYRELVEAERRKLEDLRSTVTAAEQALAATRAPIELLEERIDSLDGLSGRLRGVPVLRAFGAGVGLRSLAPADDARPERCITCHLGMVGTVPVVSGSSESERRSRWWTPHPSPDLFLGDSSDDVSPHRLDEIGCVACHGGDGAATDFAAAGHRPRDEETEARWRRDWGWRTPAPSMAPKPILGGSRVEASCSTCHDGPWLRGAPTLEAGRLLARSMACAACHETGHRDLTPSAPSLAELPRRKRAGWVRAFLADPSAWKPTFMPHFWDEVPVAERDAEIAAVVAWLWSESESPSAEAPTVGTLDANDSGPVEATGGEVEAADEAPSAAGRRLWVDLGCGACHLVEPARREQLLGSQRLRGPSLASLGVEAGRDAIEFALKRHSPSYVWRDGEVPALSDFLSTLSGSGEYDIARDGSATDTSVRDDLLRARLLEVTTHEDTAAWMERLDDSRRTLLLGRLAVRRYRCGSCHRLPAPPDFGFESLTDGEPAPASSLVEVGERFAGPSSTSWPDAGSDRGVVPTAWPHPLATAASKKVGGLPSWRLSPREAEALAVQLAGWRQGARRRGQEPGAAGRDAVARHGCRACHQMAVAGPVDFFARRAEPPPSLAWAGEKLRAEWIFHHLGDPEATALRPWNTRRMPRFDLSDEERSEVAEFFAARARVAVFSPEVQAPSSAERALGEAVFQVLICDGCHDADAPARAPRYGTSGRRLRAEWLRRWLLEPHGPTGMPTPFPPRDGRPDATYLLATLEAPMFDVQRNRLERFYLGRSDLDAAFDDAEAVADALARYVLTLGD